MASSSSAHPDTPRYGQLGERRREQRGWYLYDWANQVFITSVVTVLIGPYLSGLACSSAGAPSTTACTGGDYTVSLLGAELHANALYPATTTAAIVLQVILLPIMGALADHSPNKKRWLFFLALAGSVSTTGLFFTGGNHIAAAALFLFANVAYGASLVIYNSFLPDIATPDERDRVSSTGWAVSYLGGALLLTVHLVLVSQHQQLGITEEQAVRVAFASSGIWWIGFTILALRPLRNRASKLVTASRTPQVRTSVRQLGRTLRDIRKYPQTLLFLLAFILFNDGVQASIRYAAPFATQDLDLGQGVLMGTILMIQFVAFGGALLVALIARAVGTKRAILGTLVVWCVLVALAYAIPANDPVLFMALGAGIGIVLGGTQALARSIYSHLIPRGKEAEYFSLYQISDKGSTLLGSLTVTIAVTVTGGYRVAILSLIAFFLLGGFLLAKSNIAHGIKAAGNTPPRNI
ncbi:UMF1 family MFS transporter [Haloactinospora alba]|uniref:UMF1 family MFS transporter n=1 Tax=Haloactinospora alba TaxID=405555 RepID=A0A543NIC0_9ACTN|nr:MFS transporter [Haloactinospora alba]TQN31587.1 UMF1 family MFS transporter [Haloactinospora alba]